MKIKSQESEQNTVLTVAGLMCAAVRTAPKARGLDKLVTLILTDADKEALVNRMLEVAKSGYKESTFSRDAGCVMRADAIVLIGTKKESIGLDCGFCGFESCKKCESVNALCAYNSGDLGIAVGSAVSVAAANHIDNRIMYTAGYAAVKFEMLGDGIKIAFGIPLSATGKNIFFDRK